MKKVEDLLPTADCANAVSKRPSATAAGPFEPDPDAKRRRIDTINQVFALFQLNFHNQYFAAFGNSAALEARAKRLWKEALAPFSDEQILRAARRVVEECEYLPTLHRMIRACEEVLVCQGLPELRAAYLEAATKPSPKNAQPWSHPLVYHAGRATGWELLREAPEAVSFPAFARAWRELVRRHLAGEVFTVDRPALPERPAAPPLDPRRAAAALANLKRLVAEE